ncbi:MAG: rod shape-determining protein RodA [Nitrospinota bacterium]|nr:rod shape-determining protein RodA [Nitrospinota bacterium]
MEKRNTAKGELGKRWYAVFDWVLFITALIIAVCGIIFVYSATFSSSTEYFQRIYIKQIEWNIYGMILMIFLCVLDYRNLERPAYLVYGIFVLLLLSVLLSGRVISGSQRWISIAGMNMQPSELIKVVLVITLARYFDDQRDKNEMGFRALAIPGIIMAIPAFLIFKQPDLGTALIMAIIFSVMAFVSGIRRNTLAIIIVSVLIAIPAMWFNLKPYQKNRVMAMLDPASDPLGIGYHTIQSKIAIGSGGLWGKGIFAGTQSKLNFLPEKHTDFIFSVFAEEVGFFGAMLLLTLYLLMFLRMIDIILKAKDRGGVLLAVGGTTIIAFHFFYNVSMTLGIVPIVGIPMPLFSYGGSSIITNYAILGILQSVHMRRYRHD